MAWQPNDELVIRESDLGSNGGHRRLALVVADSGDRLLVRLERAATLKEYGRWAPRPVEIGSWQVVGRHVAA